MGPIKAIHIKVRVYFNPPFLNKKSETMWMTRKAINFYRENKSFSPYKKISILKK